MLLTLLLLFLALVALGTPLAFSIGIASAALFWLDGISLAGLIPRMFRAVDSYSLLAIPLFVLAGEMMNQSGITQRLIRLAAAIVGRLRAGLAQVNILASVLFAGISGSATADCAALGSILIPSMKERGYPADYSAVVTATSSTIGPIIPPSVTMIIYSSLTGVSVASLFLAGILPGILLAGALMITAYIIARIGGFPTHPDSETWSIRELIASFKPAILPLLTPVIIVGGVIGGVFTATESGTMGVLYTTFLGLFVYKSLDGNAIFEAIIRATVVSSTILFIISVSTLFAHLLTINNFGSIAVGLLTVMSEEPWAVLLATMAIFLLFGSFVEGVALIVIFAPFLAPVALNFGLDPIHYAMVILLGVYIGSVTPPVGVLLLLACGIAKIPFLSSLRMLLPFLFAMIVTWLVIAFVPETVTVVPNALGF